MSVEVDSDQRGLFELTPRLAALQMVVFGWQTYLNASDFTDELVRAPSEHTHTSSLLPRGDLFLDICESAHSAFWPSAVQELNVQQAQRVKARHPDSAVLIYIDGLRVQPFYGALKPIMRDPQYQDFFLRNDDG